MLWRKRLQGISLVHVGTADLLRSGRLLLGTVASRAPISTTSLGSVAAETAEAARARTVVNRADCIFAENGEFSK